MNGLADFDNQPEANSSWTTSFASDNFITTDNPIVIFYESKTKKQTKTMLHLIDYIQILGG